MEVLQKKNSLAIMKDLLQITLASYDKTLAKLLFLHIPKHTNGVWVCTDLGMLIMMSGV